MSDNLQRIVERMVHDKWITGRTYVTPDMVTLQLTDLGRRQIGKLAKYVRPFEDRFLCDVTRRVSVIDYLKLMVAILIHAPRLHLPPMSFEEYQAFVILLASEARKLRLCREQ